MARVAPALRVAPLFGAVRRCSSVTTEPAGAERDSLPNGSPKGEGAGAPEANPLRVCFAGARRRHPAGCLRQPVSLRSALVAPCPAPKIDATQHPLFTLTGTSVEPAIGIVKNAIGFDHFRLRGQKKAAIEWTLSAWHSTAGGWPRQNHHGIENKACLRRHPSLVPTAAHAHSPQIPTLRTCRFTGPRAPSITRDEQSPTGSNDPCGGASDSTESALEQFNFCSSRRIP